MLAITNVGKPQGRGVSGHDMGRREGGVGGGFSDTVTFKSLVEGIIAIVYHSPVLPNLLFLSHIPSFFFFYFFYRYTQYYVDIHSIFSLFCSLLCHQLLESA
jgi:hypothetical protein